MRLIVVTEEGDNYSLDVDAEMEIENLSALLEAESGVSTEAQILYFGQNELRSPQATLKSVGVKQDDMILMRRNDRATASTSIAQPPASSSQAPSSSAYASNPSNSLPFEQSEMMRLQLLGDPQLLARLRSTHPEMASAAESHPQRFHQLLPQLANMRQQSMMEQQRNQELLESDPFDIEAQRRIEEAIREEAVYENLEHAMEYSPESFGRVEMLYVNVEVNGRPVKAFVDSGAQATIS
ncbi:uncharacterized protein L969DRAFT_14732 [Mixia osmundae IAM 14324]|uniref:uncharacterized protein n=1 Tax=Mixia osmundae (strain CBS 9802 / IAM 14324 / JCM 22182 / KY 12970) TaxID=764103 RepID=UPI0004A5503A|nr:uncharacterized protein L969DRAFT_14732 [Mixia osmundae IAM 14324]KEI42539.1 hypothetical protein L969DRAFT_14732 [Mixia osmundae IAM 14324]